MNDVTGNFILLKVEVSVEAYVQEVTRSELYFNKICVIVGNEPIRIFLEANLFKCVQINDSLKQANKRRRERNKGL